MAQKSTVYKADLQIVDMDRGYYENHSLTVAQHPSETDERMMMRILAFGLHASDALSFANGLSVSDEPDLWEKDLTGAIALWVIVGLPDERAIKKACGRASQVVAYSYGHAAKVWATTLKSGNKFDNLTVWNIPENASLVMAKLVERNMKIQLTKQDGVIWILSKDETIEFKLESVKSQGN